MTCPNCSHPMSYVNLDKQVILHCPNCGSCLFEENGINRISLDSAQKLVSDRKNNEISGREKICPLDHAPLRPVDESEAVPQNITLLRCENCRRLFVFPDDLIAFKKAQAVKIEYFKAWAKPLPAIKTVVVVSLVLVVAGAVFSRINTILKYYSQPTKASDLIKNFHSVKSGHYLLIVFKTNSPFRSKIIFEDRTTGQTFEKIINQQPSTTHQLTTGDLNLENEIWYQIVLINKEGKETRTELKKLIISN